MKAADLKKFREAKKKLKIQTRYNAVASFGILLTDGKWMIHQSGACHAGLDKNWNPPASEPLAIVNCIQKHPFSEEEERVFLEWLFHFSPYADIISTKSVRKAMSEGYYVVDTDAPGNFVGGACMVERHFNEHPAFLRTWFKLVHYGVNPDVAYVLSNKFATTDTGRFSTQDNSHCCIPGYRAVNGDLPWNFARHEQKQPSTNYRKSFNYGVSSFLWMTKGKVEKVDPIWADLVKQISEVQRVKARSNNPFGRQDVNELNVDAVCEAMAPVIKEHQRKHNV